jgi:hypothetical protein
VARSVIRGLALAIMVGDESMVLPLSVTVMSFSYLPANCRQLVQMGLLTCLPGLLSHGYKSEITSVAVELLWNLLENSPETKKAILEPQPSLAFLVKPEAAAEPSPVDPGRAEEAGPQAEPAEPDTPTAGSRGGDLSAESDGPSSAAAPLPQPREAEREAGPEGAEGGDVAAASPSSSSPAAKPGSVHIGAKLAHALTGLFLSLLGQGFREVDKELRNTVLVVINLVLDASPAFCQECHNTGLFEAVLAVSCAPECCDGLPHVKPWALSTEELDLELKMLCWNATTTGCVLLPDAQQVAKAAGLMPMLLQYLQVDSPPPAVLRWNADRCSSLRSAALSVLHRVAPIMVEQYLSHGGIRTALLLLAVCPVPVHVEAALHHLHVLCAAAPEMAEALGEAGCVGILLDLAQSKVAAWPEPLRQAALQLLALVCQVNVENQRRLRKANGVPILLQQLSEACTVDPTLPSPLALAVLDAVWSGIVPDRKNVAKFLVSDGMDLLLSMLESGNRGHKAVVLSILADMLENPRTHSFFHDWRSDRDKETAAHVLIKLWKVRSHGCLLACLLLDRSVWLASSIELNRVQAGCKDGDWGR